MRTRRALSSVVGMVFAIIALTTTIAYVSYSMNVLSQYNQGVLGQNQQLLNLGKEKFQVTGATITSGKFNITVANTGNIPINFTKIWIQNTTGGSDWTRNYVPVNSLVSPGSTLTNIGQNTACCFLPSFSYKIKLVTSRGSTQVFNVNSANSAPLNIQLLAVPANLPSGYNTQLLMIVTNNGSSTLINVTPQTPTESAGYTATCALVQNQASPPSYNSLLPGNTAIFEWNMTVKGTTNGQICKWTAKLQNGYPGNSASATVTVTQITLASTVFAQNSGIITLNYTTFRWTEGTSWNTGWAPPGSQAVAFSVNMTNNNSTAGSNFYISKNTLAFILNAGGSTVNKSYYIVNATTLSPLGATAYSCVGPPVNDYCIGLPPGGTVRLYFYATTAGSGTQSPSNILPGPGTPLTFTILITGKYATSQNAAGSLYGQSLPYVGIVTS